MGDPLAIRLVQSAELSQPEREELLALCSRAFHCNYAVIYQTFVDPTHLLGTVEGALVCHALWITRWLQTSTSPLLRTAFVEAVATEPAWQGHSYATQVMRRLHAAIGAFDLAALSTGIPGFYRRLGWETWHGPLFIRTNGDLLATPDDTVMILRLPRTPSLDLGEPLSAEWREGELW
jgi:aminoglycoside 2'-N-acetyltransferase I